MKKSFFVISALLFLPLTSWAADESSSANKNFNALQQLITQQQQQTQDQIKQLHTNLEQEISSLNSQVQGQIKQLQTQVEQQIQQLQQQINKMGQANAAAKS